MSNKPEQIQVPQKIISISTIFDESTGHRVTQFYSVSRISITYISYLIIFHLILKNIFMPYILVFSKSSAFAEGGNYFEQKKLRIFWKKHYINYRYDRRFAENLRPSHFWQTNSI